MQFNFSAPSPSTTTATKSGRQVADERAQKRRERAKAYKQKRGKKAKRGGDDGGNKRPRLAPSPVKRSASQPPPARAKAERGEAWRERRAPAEYAPRPPPRAAPPPPAAVVPKRGRRVAQYDPSRRAAAAAAAAAAADSAPAVPAAAAASAPARRPAAIDADAAPIEAVSEHIFGDKGATTSEWSSLGLNPETINALCGPTPRGLGLLRPTLVQQLTIPHLLHRAGGTSSSGGAEPRRDTLIKSETGSGKTLAFLVPVIEHVVRTAKWDLASGPAATARRIRRTDGIVALIIGPTRELCLQIYNTVQQLTLQRTPWVVSGMICGGEKRKAEKARLRKGVTILIATPGRLHDHLAHTASVNVTLLRWLILDEADRLLDFGFAPKIEEIVNLISEKRRRAYAALHADMANHTPPPFQRILCSATLGAQIEELAAETLVNPRVIDADATAAEESERAAGDGEFAVPRQLKQFFVEVAEKQRLLALIGCMHHLLVPSTEAPSRATGKGKGRGARKGGSGDGPAAAAADEAAATATAAAAVSTVPTARKVVIFASTRSGVDLLHAILQRVFAGALTQPDDVEERGAVPSTPGAAMHVYRLHGTIDQEERTAALAAFCAAGPLGGSSISSVLVCTDVAARGLNLPHVDWIVQYDPPSELSDYIHRIGRTARSGQSGCSLLFVLPSERSYIELLHAKQSGAAKKLSGGGSTAEKAVESAVALIQPLSLGSLLDELRVLSGVKVKPSKRGRGGGGGDDAARATSMAIARMQRALFATIEGDATLRELAVSAYLSWVRAYTTHSRGTKHIFTLRAVHLGHIARSFALKDQPKSAEEKVREEKAVAEAAMKARAAALSVEGQEAVAAAFFSNMGQRAATSVADSSSRTDHSKRLSLAPREENDKGISEKRSAHRWEAHDEFAM